MSSKDPIKDSAIFSIVATGAAVLAGSLIQNALEEGWKSVKEEEPPKDPASEDVSWSDAIAWTVATGVAVGLTKLLVKKVSAKGWKKLTGTDGS